MDDLIYTMITLAIIGGLAVGGMLLLQVAAWVWYRHDGGRRHFPSVCAGRYNKTTVARILAGGAPC